MKRIIIVFLFYFLLTGLLFTQESKPTESGMKDIRKNSFYTEIMGNAGLISINYERLLPLGVKTGLGFRIGTGTAEAWTGLVEVNFIYGQDRNYLETGIGYTDAFDYPDQWCSIKLGYRYQGTRGFLFKIAPMYIYNFERLKGNFDVFGGIWAGASFGYSF